MQIECRENFEIKNVLVSSNGYSGNIIVTTQMKDYFINGTFIAASCGVKGPLLSQKACENSLSGFEFMIGFPGTIGGEIFMNASCHGQCISDNLIRCCLFDKEKKEVVYKEKSEMGFGYRTSILQGGKYILLGAEFELKKTLKEEIEALMQRNLESRKGIQPTLKMRAVFLEIPLMILREDFWKKRGLRVLICQMLKFGIHTQTLL